jgi:hypothetical protein
VPKGKHLLKGRLVCKCKHNEMGQITCYKVRYVAKGFTQWPGVNYDKTTVPMACLKSL